tara:strand:+ start:18131 stop:18502 length:372 start_codon:yes stop_codon:yes gene_type:complete
MKAMNRIYVPLFVIFALFAGMDASADDLRDRFKKRLPQIVAMKKALVVGENNQGYLEARGNLDGAQKGLVKDENNDRKALYRSIASKAGVDEKTVAVRRAADIRKKAEGGIWVQKPDGDWERR